MVRTTKGRIHGSRPPAWIIDELRRDPELLASIAAIVRAFRAPADRAERIAVVLAAFDRQRTSPSRDGGMLAGFVTVVADLGVQLDGWDDDALRAILASFAVHCPVDELDGMVARAREENEWLASLERGAA